MVNMVLPKLTKLPKLDPLVNIIFAACAGAVIIVMAEPLFNTVLSWGLGLFYMAIAMSYLEAKSQYIRDNPIK